MMVVVKRLAHECHVGAMFWLIENISDFENYEKKWGINGHWIDPMVWLDNIDPRLSVLISLINLSNHEMRKTHVVEINFKDEEDAVWFKTTWG